MSERPRCTPLHTHHTMPTSWSLFNFEQSPCHANRLSGVFWERRRADSHPSWWWHKATPAKRHQGCARTVGRLQTKEEATERERERERRGILNGRVKSGQRWSGQNRPTDVARDSDVLPCRLHIRQA